MACRIYLIQQLGLGTFQIPDELFVTYLSGKRNVSINQGNHLVCGNFSHTHSFSHHHYSYANTSDNICQQKNEQKHQKKTKNYWSHMKLFLTVSTYLIYHPVKVLSSTFLAIILFFLYFLDVWVIWSDRWEIKTHTTSPFFLPF